MKNYKYFNDNANGRNELFELAYDFPQEYLVKYILGVSLAKDISDTVEYLIENNFHFGKRLAEIKFYLDSISAKSFEDYEKAIENETRDFIAKNISEIKITNDQIAAMLKREYPGGIRKIQFLRPSHDLPIIGIKSPMDELLAEFKKEKSILSKSKKDRGTN